MKYIIHACNNRMWYVNDYLIPSMLEQGIPKKDIQIACDVNNIGNLGMWLQTCEQIMNQPGGYWHLQDDVIACADFKKRTELADDKVICGFASSYDSDSYFATGEPIPIGEVPIEKIWFSFCCIYIPNRLVREFIEWWYKIAIRDGEVIRVCINTKKNDDWAFRLWLTSYHQESTGINLKPNLVDHIDFLLGGSQINRTRGTRNTRALYFEDVDLVEKLAYKLNTNESD